jgi:hypothetical protein
VIDEKKTDRTKALAVFVLIILTFGAVTEAHGDNALVTIDFRLKNIAISKDRDSQPNQAATEPGGIDYSIGHMIVSNEEIKDAKGEAASKYPEIERAINEIEKETKWGRTLDIRWKTVNYEPRQDIVCTPSNGYQLFGITWQRRKIDYHFRNKEGKWKVGQSVPTTFRFKSPSPATIIGFGDVPVFIPGLTFDLRKVGLWSIEKVVSKEDYTIVVECHDIANTQLI